MKHTLHKTHKFNPKQVMKQTEKKLNVYDAKRTIVIQIR